MELETPSQACRASSLSYCSVQSGQSIRTADSTRTVCFLLLGEMTTVSQLNVGCVFRLQSVR